MNAAPPRIRCGVHVMLVRQAATGWLTHPSRLPMPISSIAPTRTCLEWRANEDDKAIIIAECTKHADSLSFLPPAFLAKPWNCPALLVRNSLAKCRRGAGRLCEDWPLFAAFRLIEVEQLPALLCQCGYDVRLSRATRFKQQREGWESVRSYYTPNVIDTVRGEYYFGLKCPNTGRMLAIEDDDSRGQVPFGASDVIATCHHCQSGHTIPGSAVFSFKADGSE